MARTSKLVALILLLAWQAPAIASEFAERIVPLLQTHCLRCHSGSRPKGDLNLTTRAGLLEGGAGGPALVPGSARRSRLFEYIRDQKMPPKKPLAAADVDLLRRWIDAGAPWEGPALSTPRQAEGHAGPDWWSLQPIHRPPLPPVKDRAWVRNPIDTFVRARVEANGLTPAPEADVRTLIRRVTVDLTGLLPTPEEVETFVSNRSPDAYERLVDRLLASPAYGERWARHWLDVVRFAESHGYEMNTLRPNAWPYRDYVIRAFNRDTPFAQFVQEQLAGDAAGDALTAAATGFLVGGTHDMVGNATVEGQLQQRMDDLYDMVSATGSTFLGLTVNCARCHDHKFDPILQKDFYGLQAVFAGVQHAERPMLLPGSEQRRRELARVRADIATIDRRLDDLERPAEPPGTAPARPPVNARRNVERFPAAEARFVRFTVSATTDGTEPCIDELEIFAGEENVALASAGAKATASSVFPNSPLHRIKHINDGQVGNSRSWISNERGKGWVRIELPRTVWIDRVVWGRDREQKFADRLASSYTIETSADGKRWTAIAGSWDRAPYRKEGASPASGPLKDLLDQRRQLEARLAALQRTDTAYLGTFQQPGPTFLLKRGDPMQKLEEVPPSAIRSVAPALVLDPLMPERQRRLALARWIGDVRNSLPARVLVNRLWQHHFGQGLVRTPSDFGFNGDRPSHPELLDWLASEFLANGGRAKPLHRLIVLSSTYRQSSRSETRARALDAGDRLLWRYPPRRLEAEAIRDAMLQVSGSLNRRMGGPGYDVWKYSGYVIVFEPKAKLGPDEFRRMVYQFKPRTQQDPTFGAFDCPDATQAMPRRNVSNTALQALNLLNGPLVEDQSERFAARLSREVGADVTAQVRRAFLLAFGRLPSDREREAGEKLVRQEGLSPLCRVMYNANEFLFID
jgi:hypothetical protein